MCWRCTKLLPFSPIVIHGTLDASSCGFSAGSPQKKSWKRCGLMVLNTLCERRKGIGLFLRLGCKTTLDRFNQIETLFQETSVLPDSERSAFLNQACQGDLTLEKAVLDLLRAAQVSFSDPAWEASALANESAWIAGQMAAQGGESRVGARYQLEGRLGSGGMGAVYRAIRTDEGSAQPVAVKILHADCNAESTARFHQERRILARLDHPNIARLLDDGTTAEGLPYLVMELVDGVDLLTYTSSAEHSVSEILRIFQKICAAVAYTHAHLIAHRDLKPANILITRASEPKLLDFGIATLLDGSALRTKTGFGALTPEYASPEQVQGGFVGPSSDIYTLGVLLYQMLSGKLPYKEITAPINLAEAIVSQSPIPLQHKSKSVDSDLEMIVSKALRKEPDRRYHTIVELSADIDLFLSGYPVSARPDSAPYRFRKFVKRNLLVVCAGAITISAILIGAGAAIVQGPGRNTPHGRSERVGELLDFRSK